VLKRFVGGSAFDEPERSHQRQAPGHCLVTFNGRRFDVPVLVARCMRLGIPWPWYWREKSARIRYNSDGHLDLSDELTDFGATPPCGLDAWSRMIGLPGKTGDGASVEGLAAAGEWERIGRYCAQDVRLTGALLLRWLLVRGRVSPDEEAVMLRLLESAEPEISVMRSRP
jgi:predicted PolB exonuclease-like 3'-5' exonuclease